MSPKARRDSPHLTFVYPKIRYPTLSTAKKYSVSLQVKAKKHSRQHAFASTVAVMQEGFPLHWPLIDSPHMQTQLAKRELEKKRLEDARLYDPPLSAACPSDMI